MTRAESTAALLRKIEELSEIPEWEEIAQLADDEQLDAHPVGSYWRAAAKDALIDDMIESAPRIRRRSLEKRLRKEILEGFLHAAEAGHAQAAYELGNIYEFGYGVKESEERALEWYEAAWRGDPNDATIAFKFGKALKEANIRGDEAIAALERVVSLGDGFESNALTHIAKIYTRGLCGAPSDAAKAMPFLEQASDLGSNSAKAELAHALARGNGVERNLPRALQLLKDANAGTDGLFEDALERVRGMLEEGAE